MPFELSAEAAATWRVHHCRAVLHVTEEYIDIQGYSYVDVRIYRKKDAFDLLFRGSVIKALQHLTAGEVFSRGDWYALDECIPHPPDGEHEDIPGAAQLRRELRTIADSMQRIRTDVCSAIPRFKAVMTQIPADRAIKFELDGTKMIQIKGTGLSIAMFLDHTGSRVYTVDLERAYVSHSGDPFAQYEGLSAEETALLTAYRERPLARMLEELRNHHIRCGTGNERDAFYAIIANKTYRVWHEFLQPDKLYVRAVDRHGDVYDDARALPEEVRDKLRHAQIRDAAKRATESAKEIHMASTSAAKQDEHQGTAAGKTAEGTADATREPSAVSSAWESFKANYGDKLTGMARRAACRTFVDLVTVNVAKLIAGKDADDAARSRIAEGLKSPVGRALVGFLVSVFVRNTLIRFTKEESDFLKAVTDELEEEAGSIVIGELFGALVGPLQAVLNIVATQVATATAPTPPTPELPEGIQGSMQDERIRARDKVPALHQPIHRQVRPQMRPHLSVPLSRQGDMHA